MLKKLFFIFLIAWLPLFISTASAASLQMTLTNLNAAMQSNMVDVTPCHQHAGDAQESFKKHNEVPSKQHHVCTVCGFCAVSSGYANMPHAFNLQMTSFSASQPAYFTAVFHSQSYPPAIRPPILH